jgi:hypothetical protein
MDRKLNEEIATGFRNNLKQVDEMAKEHDARMEEIEKKTGQDLSSKKVVETGIAREVFFRGLENRIDAIEHPYIKEQFKSAIEKVKEEQQAPSQVSPCLDTLEYYLKQPDTTLASNAVRDCIRKYVEFCRSNK